MESKGDMSFNVSLAQESSFRKEFLVYQKRKDFLDLQEIYCLLCHSETRLLGVFFFFFSAPSLFDAFLLSVLHCCLMDDDLEFFLVNLTELIMLVHERKNGFLKF